MRSWSTEHTFSFSQVGGAALARRWCGARRSGAMAARQDAQALAVGRSTPNRRLPTCWCISLATLLCSQGPSPDAMLLDQPCDAEQGVDATMLAFGVLFCAFLAADSAISAAAVWKAQTLLASSESKA